MRDKGKGKNKKIKVNGKEGRGVKGKDRKAAEKAPRKSSSHDRVFISIIVLLSSLSFQIPHHL